MRTFTPFPTGAEFALHSELAELHVIRNNYLTHANSLLDEIISKIRHGSVLIVDDDDSHLHTFHSILTTHGYDVSLASTSHLAITLAKSHQYDIIFLDWCMPGKSGPELYFDLRESNPDAVVVVVTGYHHLLDALARKVTLDIHTLQKPVDMDEVLQITHNAANGHSDGRYLSSRTAR